jgi:hypothetical protein
VESECDVADGIVTITLSGEVCADHIGCVVTELNAIHRLGQGITRSDLH